MRCRGRVPRRAFAARRLLASAGVCVWLTSGCADQAPRRTAVDPANGLPACVTHHGELPRNGPNSIEQSVNSAPPGFGDLSPGCVSADAAAARPHRPGALRLDPAGA
jgi:hypothetical protein